MNESGRRNGTFGTDYIENENAMHHITGQISAFLKCFDLRICIAIWYRIYTFRIMVQSYVYHGSYPINKLGPVCW